MGEIYLLRSELARLDGRLPMAQDLAAKAIVEFRATKSNFDLTLGLASLGSIQAVRGDLQNADASLTEASKNYDSVHQSVTAPEAQGAIELARAELLLAKDQFPQAADLARRAAADFSSVRLHENSVRALAAEADALDMLGRTSEALQASKLAQAEAGQTPDPAAAAIARLIAWRLSSDSQEPADLRATIATLKNPELMLEEDLAHAMRAKRSGASNAKPMLTAMASRATSTGYLTLARRARALAQ